LSHVIDLVMMQVDQQKYCRDVHVMRGLIVGQTIKRLGFSHMRGCGSIYKLAPPANRDVYICEVFRRGLTCRPDFCSECNWQKLHFCIVPCCRDAIGHGKQRQLNGLKTMCTL